MPLNSTHYACRAAEGHDLCVGGAYSPWLVGPDPAALHCPVTCVECPNWESHADAMWLIVLVSSVSSPLMVMLTLRFLRGDGE